MGAYLYRDRGQLSANANALLALAFDHFGHREQRDGLMRNVQQYLVTDPENQTARLRLPNSSSWWSWYGNNLETNALYLRLLCRTQPKGETAAGLAKYLVNNRRNGTYWTSTRDTAFCVEALADFLRSTGTQSRATKASVELWVDGTKRQELQFTPETLFFGDHRMVLKGESLAPGRHNLELRKTGDSPLFTNAFLSTFTLEDHISPAGLDLKITRHYWKLTPKERVEIKDGDALNSGDVIEAELDVDAKNDCEYILIEDPKPAGLETIDQRSGYTANALNAYQELHDDSAAFFVRQLPLGKNKLTYRLRVETPGIFRAIPAKATAMYAPELTGNSAEIKVKVQEK
jgi:uncharacterized protein YfaS (alpha-2-macroglobulin family)